MTARSAAASALDVPAVVATEGEALHKATVRWARQHRDGDRPNGAGKSTMLNASWVAPHRAYATRRDISGSRRKGASRAGWSRPESASSCRDDGRRQSRARAFPRHRRREKASTRTRGVYTRSAASGGRAQLAAAVGASDRCSRWVARSWRSQGLMLDEPSSARAADRARTFRIIAVRKTGVAILL